MLQDLEVRHRLMKETTENDIKTFEKSVAQVAFNPTTLGLPDIAKVTMVAQLVEHRTGNQQVVGSNPN